MPPPPLFVTLRLESEGPGPWPPSPRARFRAGLANQAGLDSVGWAGWVGSYVLPLARAVWPAPLLITVNSFTILVVILVYW